MVGDLDPSIGAPCSAGEQKLPHDVADPGRGFKPCWVSLQLKGECPIGWWGHTVNYTDGKLYVSGGYGKQRSAEIYCVSPTTWECKKLVTSGAVPGPRDSHTCATVGKDLILVGGTDGKSKKSEVYLFNTETLEWKLIQALGEPPTPREGHTACVIDSKLVIFGGMGEELAPEVGCAPRAVYLGDIVFLDLKTYTWQRADVNEGPAPRDSHAAAAAGNRLVVFGGDRGDQYLDDVWIFTMDTMRWTQAELTSSLAPGPRAGHISVSVGPNSILVFGGVGPDQENNNDSWILHIGPDESHGLAAGQACWEVLEVTGNHLPQGRFAHAADVEDGCLYVIGGCTATAQPMCDFHVLCLTEEAACRMPAGSAKASRRDGDGQPKKVTSYNLFCSHHRVGLRDENPGLSAREVERLMGQKWSQLSAEEKKPYEDEAYRIYATNLASFKAAQGVGVPPVDLSDPVIKREHGGLENTFAKRQKMDPGQVQALHQPTQVCQIYSPNPSLLGAQVEGHVDGAFNSGYLATVRVNGFTYRALLFSPYLALPTPGIAALGPVAHVAHDPSGIPTDQLGHGPPNVVEPSALVPSTAPLSGTPAAPLLPSSHLSLQPALMLPQHQGAQPVALSSTVGMPSQFQMSAPAAVANGTVQPLDAVQVMNGG